MTPNVHSKKGYNNLGNQRNILHKRAGDVVRSKLNKPQGQKQLDSKVMKYE